MFIFKKKYFLIIESIKDINLKNIKIRNKFSIIYRNNKKNCNFNDLLMFRRKCKLKAIISFALKVLDKVILEFIFSNLSTILFLFLTIKKNIF